MKYLYEFDDDKYRVYIPNVAKRSALCKGCITVECVRQSKDGTETHTALALKSDGRVVLVLDIAGSVIRVGAGHLSYTQLSHIKKFTQAHIIEQNLWYNAKGYDEWKECHIIGF